MWPILLLALVPQYEAYVAMSQSYFEDCDIVNLGVMSQCVLLALGPTMRRMLCSQVCSPLWAFFQGGGGVEKNSWYRRTAFFSGGTPGGGGGYEKKFARKFFPDPKT